MKKTFSLLTLLLLLCSSAWGLDCKDSIPQINSNKTGLYWAAGISKITLGNNTTIGSSCIQVGQNKTGSFTISVPDGFTIKKIQFTEKSSNKVSGLTSDDDGATISTTNKVTTYTPSSNDKTSVTFTFSGSGGSAQLYQFEITTTTSFTDTYERLTPTAVTTSNVTYTSTRGVNTRVTASTTSGSYSSGLEFGNNGTISITTNLPIKYIYPVYNQRYPTGNDKWTASGGSYDATNNVWTASTNNVKSVTFTRTESSNAKIVGFHVFYYPIVPTLSVDPSSASAFSYDGTGPSAGQTFTVTGYDLSTTITATLSNTTDYEIKTGEEGSYGAGPLSDLASGASVTVRLKSGLSSGSHNGNLTFSSTGATNVVLALSGTVTNKTATVTTISGTGSLNTDIKNGTSAGTLTAAVTAGGDAVGGATVSWSSSDPTVATVGEETGVVTLVKAGSTMITATYDGDATYAESSDTYDLTVTDTRESVTLSFSQVSITDFNYDGETLTAPTLTAKDGSDNSIDLSDLPELKYAVSGTSIVTVNTTTGVITPANNNNFGTATITASFAGNSSYKAAESKSYTVERSPMLYQVMFDNGFEAFISEADKTVNVYYMAGSSAPSQTGTIKKAADYTANVVGNTIVLTKDTHTKTYNIVSTAVTPFEGSGKQTFDGTETYVKSGYGWDGTKKWKFSKTDNDWTREAPGKSRLYFFVGAAESASLSFSTERAVKIKVNGVDAGTNVASIPLNANQLNMIEIQSNQTGGDGGFKDLTLTSPKKSAKITSAGWATFSYGSPLDLTDANRPAGLTAYQVLVEGIDESAHTIEPTEVTSTVAANTGLLLEGDAGTYYIPIVASADPLANNKMVAVTADNTTINEDYLFVLAHQGGEVVFAHTGTTAATLNKGQAYLNLNGVAHAPGMRIVLGENNATNIEAVEAAEEGVKFIQNGKLFIKKNGVVYDAMGRIIR